MNSALVRFSVFIPRIVLRAIALAFAWTIAAPVTGADGDRLDPIPAPFSPAAPDTLDRDATWTILLAQRALEAGMYHLAESLFRQAEAQSENQTATLRTIRLGLTTALVAQGKRDDALAVLERMPGARDSAWVLRQAIVDFLAGDHLAVESRLAEINPANLARADVAWAHFLRAMQAEVARERARADAAFQEAIENSTSAAATAWFRLARFQLGLEAGRVDEALLAQIARNREEFAGRPLGFEATLQYAAALDQVDREVDAVRVLQQQQRALPASERELRDRTLLLLGLIAGVDSTAGNAAFVELLETGSNVDWQRIALQQLATVADAATARARADVARLFRSLLERQAPHPLTEDLLYYRATLALRDRNFDLAEEDANRLLTRFPGSALRSGALALLASSSWQRGRHRSAADYVARLRNELPLGRDRTRLGVLLGECYFQAGDQAGTVEDFRNAAEAYARAQEDLARLAGEIGAEEAEQAAGVTEGTLFYQRVLASIRGGDMEGAVTLLSGPSAAAVDAESRWQAAWNYVRYLQLVRRPEDAFRALEAWRAAENAPPELRLKFLWLLAQLSLETGRGAETDQRVAAVRAFLSGSSGAEVPAVLRAEVESNAGLLSAQARLQQDEVDAGLRAMDALRQEYPGSRAALFSYIIQARFLSERGDLVAAQKLLIDLAEQHPDSEYAPRALYEAAEQATKRGADANLVEARDLLERLATDPQYRGNEYVFFARLEQGDILRRLNQFAAAEQVYLSLENNYPNHAARNVAQLALADTLLAQVDNDPTKFDAAISRLERLTDLPTADPDLRVEAGFKLGYGRQRQGEPDRAAEYYWDVYQRFLGEPRPDQPSVELGSSGRYWLARTLLELGEIELRAGRRESARRSFQAIVDHGLPGADTRARPRLEQLQTGG